jgi:hypothetical protein
MKGAYVFSTLVQKYGVVVLPESILLGRALRSFGSRN